MTEFDSFLRSGLCSITNSNLSDIQWLQASLPVKDGGLGIRRVVSLALPAFLASAASTQVLQSLILSRCIPCTDSSFSSLCVSWSSTNNIPCPGPPLASSQKAWDRPYIETDKATVFADALDQHHSARLLAVCAPHAGDRLHVLPISSCGLRLDNEAIRIAVGLRLGVNLCEPHPCPCGTQVDARGTHGLACKQKCRTLCTPSPLKRINLAWASACRHTFSKGTNWSV